MTKESLVEIQAASEIKYLRTMLIAGIRSSGGTLVIKEADIQTIDRDDELCMFNDFDNHCVVLTTNKAHTQKERGEE